MKMPLLYMLPQNALELLNNLFSARRYRSEESHCLSAHSQLISIVHFQACLECGNPGCLFHGLNLRRHSLEEFSVFTFSPFGIFSFVPQRCKQADKREASEQCVEGAKRVAEFAPVPRGACKRQECVDSPNYEDSEYADYKEAPESACFRFSRGGVGHGSHPRGVGLGRQEILERK